MFKYCEDATGPGFREMSSARRRSNEIKTLVLDLEQRPEEAKLDFEKNSRGIESSDLMTEENGIGWYDDLLRVV